MDSDRRHFCQDQACGHMVSYHPEKDAETPNKCLWPGCKCKGLLAYLTPREIEVVVGLAKGICLKDIAVQLNVSYNTAEAHKYNLMKKMRLHNSVQVMLFAIKHGYVKTEDLPEPKVKHEVRRFAPVKMETTGDHASN